MELRHLRYFIAVAEELNFSRAATKLGMSQPPLSHQVRQLERELGVELFWRSARGVQLTEHGEVLWLAARRLAQDADRLKALADQLQQGKLGVVRIGLVGTALLSVLPDVMAHARAQMPRVTFHFEEIESGDQVAAFSEHRIDVGVLRPPMAERLEYVPLVEEPLVAVVSADHPLSEHARISAAALRDEPFVLFPRSLGVGLYDAVVAACMRAGFLPRFVQETDRMQTVVGLVAAGEGVSIVPWCMTRLALPGVRYLGLDDPEATSILALAWQADAMTPVVRRFVDTARDFIDQASHTHDD